MIGSGRRFINHSRLGGGIVGRAFGHIGRAGLFTYEPPEYDCIVSNQPFTQKDAVLKRLYELGKPFAVLLPLNSLQSVDRYKYFRQGIQILAFDKRIAFHSPQSMRDYKKGVSFATVYFCHDILPRDLIIEELKEYKKPLTAEREVQGNESRI